ncbi:hypothetical protein FSP39_014738 [Pinctada imbricata]|uniref:Uncharacterized protein n=1 Tax=Pinctada imbricata TaxID=66713 RepID=A0AA88XS29_PINIB|nr:hypothetical protein FSP39_014738 [Pinctada imbricata]
MVSTDELIIIVGASLGGLIVFLILLAIVIYCVCGRRRRQSRKDNPFKQLPTVNNSSASKHSSYSSDLHPRLDQSIDPRLPKVGSSGLWMGTPSLYAPTQKPYYPSQPGRHFVPMQRATSEDRLTSRYMRPRDKLYKRSVSVQRYPYYDRYNYTFPHSVTQGGHVQIYHSQQLGHAPYHEPFGRLPRSNSYMDISPYAGFPSHAGHMQGLRDSRAVLVEYPDGTDYYSDPYRDIGYEENRKRGKKVQRTHSDLTGTKRKKRQRNRQESPYNKGSNHGDKEVSGKRTSSVEVHHRQSYTEQMDNNKNTKEADINEAGLSQTDSAKLRAINERNKEADTRISQKWRSADELRLDLPNESDDERNNDVSVRKYEYKGRFDKTEVTDVYIPKREVKDSKIQEPVNADVSRKNSSTNAEEKQSHVNQAYDNSDEREIPQRKTSVHRTESNTDGKQVSAAFDFLNNYMSDDEGTDFVGSRPDSPVAL